MKTPREKLDTELATALAALPMSEGRLFDLRDIAGTRAAIDQMAAADASAAAADTAVTVEVIEAGVSPGHHVSIRFFRPATRHAALPVLLWFHGGGQVLGFAGQEDSYVKRICREVGCVVASVDYRLAPESPSPAAAEDGYLAYRWLHDEASRLGIDATRMGIAGPSGGACIAAATTLMIRDREAPPPTFVVLNYPMLDDRNETASSHEITDIGIWDRANNLLAWQAILGDQVGAADVSPYCAPARSKDLTGLPPTFISVAELDVFRDEGLTYATRLMESDVPTELHVYPGAFHAWDLFAPSSGLAVSFFQAWFGYMSRHFATKA
jgi:acetyl esterase/lipase